jgi:hypothetical protein
MTQLFFPEYEEDPTLAPRPLVIVGAGGLGREIALLVSQINEAGEVAWDLRGFYDDRAPATPTVGGFPYLGTLADLQSTASPLAVAVAVGSSTSRAAVVARLSSPQLSFPALVHPQVALRPAQRIALGEGCLIQRGCILTCDITLGRFVLLNLGCTLGHDSVLEDFCSLMPHANVGGAAHLAAGAQTTVGAGAVVVRDLPASCTAVGVPAKAIKKLE